MTCTDYQGADAQYTGKETWNRLMNLRGKGVGRGLEEINQRSYLHTRGPVHRFLHQWGPLAWPAGIGPKLAVQHSLKGPGLREGTGQAEGPHWYMSPCTRPLILYNKTCNYPLGWEFDQPGVWPGVWVQLANHSWLLPQASLSQSAPIGVGQQGPTRA